MCVQSALPLIRASEGRILTIISTAGLRGKVHESIYCASKFAVKGFTESLQKEWENDPIAITAVYMGGMNTPFWDNSSHVADPSGLKGPEVVAEQILMKMTAGVRLLSTSNNGDYFAGVAQLSNSCSRNSLIASIVKPLRYSASFSFWRSS